MALILVFALIVMLTMTVFAVEVIIWQSNDISVSIDSASKEEKNDLQISVLNTAGLTLLFFENPCKNGRLEYLDNDEWVDFCEISYTKGNMSAISQQYAGMFAELNPGETWKITVPETAISEMKPGTYRIVMTYTTVADYKTYLNSVYESTLSVSSEEMSDEISLPILTSDDTTYDESSLSEPFTGIKSETFIKTFDFGQSDARSRFSIDESDVSGDEASYPLLDGKVSYLPAKRETK